MLPVTSHDFIEQVKRYVNVNWPIEPINPSNLFQNEAEIDRWIVTIPENLRDRVQDNVGFHPIKLLQLLNPKQFWTEEKIVAQDWSKGVGFRSGLTLTQPEGKPEKVQLTIAIDADARPNYKVIEVLEEIIKEYSLEDSIPIQKTPHGGYHLLLCAFVDPNDLDEIDLWEHKKSLAEGVGCWLNDAKCSIKINCQQVTLYPSAHRKDGLDYKLNKIMPLTNTAWILDKVVEAFVREGILECSPQAYHDRLAEKAKIDSASFKEFDSSEWFELTELEIVQACNLILGTDNEDFGSIYYDGCRHNNTMAIAGVCAWGHISLESTQKLFQLLCDVTDDGELEDRLHIVTETYQRILSNQAVQGKQVLTELFRGAHKSRDMGAAANRYEQFRQALGLDHKRIRKNLDVTEFLRANHGEHVQVHDIMITGIQESEKMIVKVKCRCLNCNWEWEPKQFNARPHFDWEMKHLLGQAEKSKCSGCDQHENEVTTIEINAVQVEIQDCSLASENNQTARAVLMNDASYNVRTNEECIITGFINTISNKGKRVTMLFAGDTKDEGSGITYAKNYFGNKLTPEDEAECAKFIQEHGENVLVELAKMFKISVLDYEYEKQGILLACANATKDSIHRRTRIHVLLVGDRGLAKSKLLRGATEVVPKSRYISGTTTSVKTAICVVVRDSSGAEVTRPGPIVKASGAICAVDELGTISYEDQKYFLNAVEEGLIPFGKWGLSKNLDGSATFIFSANPSGSSGTWGEYQTDKRTQIPVYGPLLDRIDLVFIFKMNRDEEYLDSYADRNLKDKERSEEVDAKETENNLRILKILLYCKRFDPELSDDVLLMIKKFYVSVAKNPVSQASHRLLNSLYNSVKALARLKGKNIADTNDAKQVIELYRKQFEIKAQLKTEMPDEPIELVKKIIVARIEGFNGYYFLPELLQNLYNEESDVRDYFGKRLVFNKGSNRKYRSIVEWVEGDPRIRMLDKGKLKIAWEASYQNTRGGKRSDTKPTVKDSVQNILLDKSKPTLKLTSDICNFEDREKVSEPSNNFQNSKNDMSACQPEHEFAFDTKNNKEQSSSQPVFAKPINIESIPKTEPAAKAVDIKPISGSDWVKVSESLTVKPIPQKLVDRIPELASFKSIDTEWDEDNWDDGIYAYCSVDQNDQIIQYHLDDFQGDKIRFLNAVLDDLEQVQVIVGFGISLLSTDNGGKDDQINGDLKALEDMCFNLGPELVERYKNIVGCYTYLDAFRLFKNRAVKGFLGQNDIKYKVDSLDAISRSILGFGKLNGISGSNAKSQSKEKQLEYCLRDAQLPILLLQQNDYEMLEIIQELASYIEMDFFDTFNANGTFRWWKHKLYNKAGLPKPPQSYYDWVNGRKIDFTGGKTFPTKPGIYVNMCTYDFSSMYPSQIVVRNISTETICCSHPEHEQMLVPDEIMQYVNKELKEPRPWHYWICPETGILGQIMKDIILKKQEYKAQKKKKAEKALKLFMNSGYGVMSYLDVRVTDLTTAFSRYTITELSKMLESRGFTIVAADTDSVFIVGDISGIEQVIEQARNRFGIVISKDKEWRILVMFPVKKQYVGVIWDDKTHSYILYHTDIYGMKDDKPPFFGDVMRGLVTKETLEQFIDPENRSSILHYVRDYVIHAFEELETRSKDFEFCRDKLVFRETSTKHMWQYSGEDKHKRAYLEILSDCNGNVDLAKKQAVKGLFSYWKILVNVETRTKKGQVKIKQKGSTTSFHLDKHYTDIDLKQYKDELWKCFEDILLAFDYNMAVELAKELNMKIDSKKLIQLSISNST